MASSKKVIAVATLKKEFAMHKKKIRKAMRKVKPSGRKKMHMMIKRLDAASRAISLVYDIKGCSSGFDDGICTFND
jgi:hypothetical protein